MGEAGASSGPLKSLPHFAQTFASCSKARRRGNALNISPILLQIVRDQQSFVHVYLSNSALGSQDSSQKAAGLAFTANNFIQTNCCRISQTRQSSAQIFLRNQQKSAWLSISQTKLISSVDQPPSLIESLMLQTNYIMSSAKHLTKCPMRCLLASQLSVGWSHASAHTQNWLKNCAHPGLLMKPERDIKAATKLTYSLLALPYIFFF